MHKAVAARYARALVDALQQRDRIDAARDELQRFLALIRTHEPLRRAFVSPVVEPRHKRAVVERLGELFELSKQVRRLIGLLAAEDRLDDLEAVAAAYAREADDALGVVEARVTAAAELDASEREACRAAVHRLTGSDVRLEVDTDPDLLGGLVVRIGSMVYDGSLENQLERLGRRLAAQSGTVAH